MRRSALSRRDRFAVRAAFWYQGEANADQKPAAADQAHGDTITAYYAR